MRTTRLFGLVLAAATVVALTADTASAQRGRRGGFGVSVGNGYGGYGSGYGYGGYGSGWGYGSGYGNGWGYGSGYGNGYSGWNSPYYSSGAYNNYSGSGYYTSPQYSYSSGYSSPMYYGNTGYATAGYSGSAYAGSSGCCDPCSGGGTSMAQGGYTQGGYNNGGFVQAGYSPNSQMGLRIVSVEAGPAQTAGIQQGSVVVAVDDRNVSSFQDLQTAIRNGGSGNNNTLKMTIIDPSGQRVTRNVAVKDNRIGVSVVEMPVSIPNTNNNQDGINDTNNNNGTNNRNQNNSTIPGQLPNNTNPNATPPSPTSPDRVNPNRTNPSSGTTTPSTTTPGSTTPGTTSPTRPRADD